ncbi:hypothetical protein [Paenibacillus planticolens]|uniref:Uncharacterized protein n=1 Tax=Paenibacillus planticolens TaxID=2654976 RepID=A0ABX1ZR32_9BACL|nr:hypothetical protein [Paenibacillus planticolens]NOV01372.1 hypothetical protein [Paenibacillus planticolens]
MDVTEEVSKEQFTEACRKQLIEDELLSVENGRYFLTEKGKARAAKELQRYQMMPAKMLLIEQYILEHYGLAIY